MIWKFYAYMVVVLLVFKKLGVLVSCLVNLMQARVI